MASPNRQFQGKYKRVKHYHEPGDFQELTFSCYERRPLLTNDTWRAMLAESITRALETHQFDLHAFVFMPEHVHLLVNPRTPEPHIDALLKAIKRPFSYRVKQLLLEANSPLVDELTVRERPGVMTFRFWQEGPGYDRNLRTAKAILASIEYIHMNPVKRKLCERIDDWKWSSARWWLSDGVLIDPDLPRLTRLPADLFD